MDIEEEGREGEESAFRIAVVCSSNVNRSAACHDMLRRHCFDVESFGIGSEVKLPGSSAGSLNCYPFGTPYEDMIKDLQEKDRHFYTNTGIIAMLKRDAKLKEYPERFQERVEDHEKFDVIFTVEERVFDAVCSVLFQKMGLKGTPVHVINMDVEDSIDSAKNAAEQCLSFAKKMAGHKEEWSTHIEETVQSLSTEVGATILHSVYFY
eukprot:TRINITY_DN11792_c0_g2_i1.p1 TRINITY_DN11792_c0_g2~~TRINITY_DN11792_c0_g2_i1.p1  ORF type:complete len:208 (+),score=65.54 TRINITY_DN11792_c0_g2_i1:42-665(+)